MKSRPFIMFLGAASLLDVFASAIFLMLFFQSGGEFGANSAPTLVYVLCHVALGVTFISIISNGSRHDSESTLGWVVAVLFLGAFAEFAFWWIHLRRQVSPDVG